MVFLVLFAELAKIIDLWFEKGMCSFAMFSRFFGKNIPVAVIFSCLIFSSIQQGRIQ